MTFSSVGDLAQSLMLRRQGAALKTQLSQLTEELTSGKRKVVSAHVKGDFGPLGGIERSLRRLDGFALARGDLTVKVSAIQTSLGSVQDSIGSFGADLLSAAALEQPDVLAAKIANASERLNQTISYLNTQSVGQFLFSGTASDQRPLASAETIMADLRALGASATDTADYRARIDSWFFDPAGGFETVAYTGGSDKIEGIGISDERSVDLPLKADDRVFRTMLRDLAVASLISEGSIVASNTEKREILTAAGASLVAGKNVIIGLRRDTGNTESALVEAQSGADVERGVLREAQSKIVAVDTFEAASALQAVQFQLETLYVLTARTSQLRLSDYLR